MDEADSWENHVPKRLKSNEMLFDDGVSTIIVEMHTSPKKLKQHL